MTAGSAPEDEAAVRDLYRQPLDRWNARDAKGYAARRLYFTAGRPDLAAAMAAELRRLLEENTGG